MSRDESPAEPSDEDDWPPEELDPFQREHEPDDIRFFELHDPRAGFRFERPTVRRVRTGERRMTRGSRAAHACDAVHFSPRSRRMRVVGGRTGPGAGDGLFVEAHNRRGSLRRVLDVCKRRVDLATVGAAIQPSGRSFAAALWIRSSTSAEGPPIDEELRRGLPASSRAPSRASSLVAPRVVPYVVAFGRDSKGAAAAVLRDLEERAVELNAFFARGAASGRAEYVIVPASWESLERSLRARALANALVERTRLWGVLAPAACGELRDLPAPTWRVGRTVFIERIRPSDD